MSETKLEAYTNVSVFYGYLQRPELTTSRIALIITGRCIGGAKHGLTRKDLDEMRRRSIIDEIEIVIRERLWLPWYERYGPDFRSEMFRYPIEQRLPPEDTKKRELLKVMSHRTK